MNTECLQHIINQRTASVELVTGKNTNGQMQYAYIVIKKSKLDAFKQSLQSQNTILSDWGVVIDSGMGEPPKHKESELLASITKDYS